MSPRRSFEAALLGAACALASCAPSPPAGERANLLLITVDTLRADHLGAYGDVRVDTPELDRWAAEALVFEDAFSSIPITVPSLATLFRSRVPRNHGALNNAYDFEDEAPTLARALEARGYRAAAFLPSFLANKAGFRAGFELYSAPRPGEALRSASELVSRALRWVEGVEAEGSGPWFLWIHVLEPHSPYAPGAELERKYVPAGAFPIPERLRSEHFLEALPRTESELAIVRGLYAGEVEATDRALAPLLAFAREHRSGGARAASGPVLSVFTADHGEMLYEKEQYIGHTGWLFEEMLRVPLWMHFSNGHRAGERSPFPAALLDLAPTLLVALGEEFPAWAEGVDLLSRGQERGRLLVHETFAPEGRFDQQALRWGSWKWIAPIASEKSGARAARLFELEGDPREQLDLAAEQVARAAELAASFEQWRRLQLDPALARRPELDETTEAQLRALGYLQSHQEEEQ